ncbi:hypothetical protein HDU96_001153 [Phlyctochytrium bullatum]|nr:hypothetical protein HDU96_001153 [Phlyctochytrium bullatum]
MWLADIDDLTLLDSLVDAGPSPSLSTSESVDTVLSPFSEPRDGSQLGFVGMPMDFDLFDDVAVKLEDVAGVAVDKPVVLNTHQNGGAEGAGAGAAAAGLDGDLLFDMFLDSNDFETTVDDAAAGSASGSGSFAEGASGAAGTDDAMGVVSGTTFEASCFNLEDWERIVISLADAAATSTAGQASSDTTISLPSPTPSLLSDCLGNGAAPAVAPAAGDDALNHSFPTPASHPLTDPTATMLLDTTPFVDLGATVESADSPATDPYSLLSADLDLDAILAPAAAPPTSYAIVSTPYDFVDVFNLFPKLPPPVPSAETAKFERITAFLAHAKGIISRRSKSASSSERASVVDEDEARRNEDDAMRVVREASVVSAATSDCSLSDLVAPPAPTGPVVALSPQSRKRKAAVVELPVAEKRRRTPPRKVSPRIKSRRSSPGNVAIAPAAPPSEEEFVEEPACAPEPINPADVPGDPNLDLNLIDRDPVTGLYPCPHPGCPYEGAARRYNLKVHYLVHLGAASKTFKCGVCLKGFRRRFDLDRHGIVVHGMSEKEALENGGPRKFKKSTLMRIGALPPPPPQPSRFERRRLAAAPPRPVSNLVAAGANEGLAAAMRGMGNARRAR